MGLTFTPLVIHKCVKREAATHKKKSSKVNREMKILKDVLKTVLSKKKKDGIVKKKIQYRQK